MKKLIIGLGLALAITIYFLVQVKPSQEEVSLPPISNNSLKTQEKTLPTSLNELAKKKINQNLKNVATQNTTAHPCNKIIDPLVEGSYEEILENSGDFYTNLKDPACQKALEPILKNNPQLLNLERQCLGKITIECESLIFFLKTWAVSLKYPNSIDLADLDETILANKLMFNFTSNPALPLEIINENLKILDEMISKDPSLFGAQKAKLIHLFAKEFQYNLDVEDEFTTTLDSINSLKSDPEIEELLMVRPFYKKKLDKEKIIENIDNFIQKYPDSPKGPYYRAALEWNIMKNPNGTKAWLEKARALAPNDPQVLHSLEKLDSAKPNQAIFYFSFNFDLQEV